MEENAQQKAERINIIKSQGDIADVQELEKTVYKKITDVTDEYSIETIRAAFLKVVNKRGYSDESTVSKLVFQALSKTKTDKRPPTKRKSKV